MRISDWSSDVCSSDLDDPRAERPAGADRRRHAARRTGARRDRYPAQFRIDHRDPAEGSARKFRARISAYPDQPLFGQYFAHRDLHRDGAVGAAPQTETFGPYRRSEEHTSELQSLMRISYAVFCLQKKKTNNT